MSPSPVNWLLLIFYLCLLITESNISKVAFPVYPLHWNIKRETLRGKDGIEVAVSEEVEIMQDRGRIKNKILEKKLVGVHYLFIWMHMMQEAELITLYSTSPFVYIFFDKLWAIKLLKIARRRKKRREDWLMHNLDNQDYKWKDSKISFQVDL